VLNRNYFTYNASFNGTSGIGEGTLAQRPSTCTTGVAYWATDQGNWNTTTPGPDGQLYKCMSTNNWQLFYTPLQYPHPLISGATNPPPPPPGPTPPPPPTPVLGDINLDHIVNSIDYSIMNSDWFSSNPRSDLNHDGIVNAIDYSLLNANWFRTW
jgi:hypothetical protein